MKRLILALILSLAIFAPVRAQQTLPDAPTAKAGWTNAPLSPLRSVQLGGPAGHQFYDKPGKVLALSALGAALADSGITCYNLHNGQGEYSTPSQNCAGVTAWLVGQVAVQEGAAYFLHRRGHHLAERAVRFISIQANVRGFATSYKARL